MIDLKRSFPLSKLDVSADFIFRVQNTKGEFYDLLNPATPVPRLGPHGSIICKIIRSPLPLPIPTESSVTSEISNPLPSNYFAYKKHLKPHNIPNPKSSSHSTSWDHIRRPSRSPINETFSDETVEAVKQGARKVQELGKNLSKTISTIDEEKIKKATRDGMKKLGTGMKGLWNNLKSTTESFVQSANSQLLTTLKVGRYTIRMQTMVAEGGFSMVYLCKDESEGSGTFGESLAVKKMICQTKEARKDATTEIKLLRGERLRVNEEVNVEITIFKKTNTFARSLQAPQHNQPPRFRILRRRRRPTRHERILPPLPLHRKISLRHNGV